MSALIFILPMPTDSVTVFVALFRCGQKAQKLERFYHTQSVFLQNRQSIELFSAIAKNLSISKNRTSAQIILFLFEINDCKTPYNFMLLQKNS